MNSAATANSVGSWCRMASFTENERVRCPQRLASGVLALLAGMTIQRAYHQVTGTEAPRNAYRWLGKLTAQLSVHRSLLHQPQLPYETQRMTANRNRRRCLLMATAERLLGQWGPPLCAGFQRTWQRAFL